MARTQPAAPFIHWVIALNDFKGDANDYFSGRVLHGAAHYRHTVHCTMNLLRVVPDPLYGIFPLFTLNYLRVFNSRDFCITCTGLFSIVGHAAARPPEDTFGLRGAVYPGHAPFLSCVHVVSRLHLVLYIYSFTVTAAVVVQAIWR